jgi:hypothetical protein
MSVDSLRGATPVFPVSDVDATANWYRDALGFEFDTFPKTPPSSRRAGRISTLPGARGPEDRFYGQREIEVRDPNGYVVVFAEQTSGADP